MWVYMPEECLRASPGTPTIIAAHLPASLPLAVAGTWPRFPPLGPRHSCSCRDITREDSHTPPLLLTGQWRHRKPVWSSGELAASRGVVWAWPRAVTPPMGGRLLPRHLPHVLFARRSATAACQDRARPYFVSLSSNLVTASGAST